MARALRSKAVGLVAQGRSRLLADEAAFLPPPPQLRGICRRIFLASCRSATVCGDAASTERRHACLQEIRCNNRPQCGPIAAATLSCMSRKMRTKLGSGLMTVREACGILGCGNTTGWLLVKRGQLPPVRCGVRATRVRLSDVNHLVNTGWALDRPRGHEAPSYREKKRPLSRSSICWVVEAAGIEPASASDSQTALHA